MKLQTLFLALVFPGLIIDRGLADELAHPVQPERDALQPHQEAFLKLPAESQREFAMNLAAAMKSFGEKDLNATNQSLDKASAIFSDAPEVHSLRGSCFIETRKFDKAMNSLRKAALLAKNNPSIEFNIGEVYFVTNRWKEGLESFQKVFKLVPPEELQLSRLVEFKILLCQMKLGNHQECSRLAAKHGVMDESPFPFYARAAVACFNNKPVESRDWTQVASRIFPDKKTLAPWNDTMIEIGFMKQ